jgi:NDP-sugar pyrophosphorylase family protein
MSLAVEAAGELEAHVLCGGAGTRLRALVADRPKPLAPVGGRPFLDVLLAWLEREGVRRFVLCAGFGAEAIRAALSALGKHGEIRLSLEDRPLGTGGALRRALEAERRNPVLALNGDSICPLDLAAMLAQHRRAGARLSVAVARAREIGDYGAIRLAPDGRIESFSEKPERGAREPGLVNAGVYLLDGDDFVRRSPPGAFSLEADWFPRVAREGGAHGYLHAGPFLDIGTPDRYRIAEQELARLGLL